MAIRWAIHLANLPSLGRQDLEIVRSQWIFSSRTRRSSIQRQLQKLQGQQRHNTEGKHSIKSGLHCAGDNAVTQLISWPHHYCFPSAGGQLPAAEYKELSPLQFMIGFLGCLQDESSNSVRSNMIEYGRHLFQDALEMNWATAKHAPMVLLKEIERGKCSWHSPDLVEKIQIRTLPELLLRNQH